MMLIYIKKQRLQFADSKEQLLKGIIFKSFTIIIQ